MNNVHSSEVPKLCNLDLHIRKMNGNKYSPKSSGYTFTKGKRDYILYFRKFFTFFFQWQCEFGTDCCKISRVRQI